MGNPTLIKMIALRVALVIIAIYTTSIYRIDLGYALGVPVGNVVWGIASVGALKYVADLLSLRHVYVGRRGALIEFKGTNGSNVLATVADIGVKAIRFVGDDGSDIYKPTADLATEPFRVLSGRQYFIEEQSFVLDQGTFEKYGLDLIVEAKVNIVSLGGLYDKYESLSERIICYFENFETTDGQQKVRLRAKFPILRVRSTDSGRVDYLETKNTTFLALKAMSLQK